MQTLTETQGICDLLDVFLKEIIKKRQKDREHPIHV